MRRFAPYAKLGVWGQTQWSKVLTLYPIPYTLYPNPNPNPNPSPNHLTLTLALSPTLTLTPPLP